MIDYAECESAVTCKKVLIQHTVFFHPHLQLVLVDICAVSTVILASIIVIDDITGGTKLNRATHLIACNSRCTDQI